MALGAFGAHALRPQLLARGLLDVWQTAVLYHLIHAVCLLGAALAVDRFPPTTETSSVAWSWVVRCWTAGIILFSGSLYLLALGGPRWLGPVTPLGGIALLAGWILVAFTQRRTQP